MKHLIILTLSIVFLVSCQKEIRYGINSSTNLENVKESLKDSLSASDYINLDFSKMYLAQIKDSNIQLMRIPFINKKIANDFILVQLNSKGCVERGRIIHIERDEPATTEIDANNFSFKGAITISALNGQIIVQSDITNGFIKAFHPETFNLRTSVVPVLSGIIELPEVVVVGYIHSGGISYSDWYYLLGLLGNTAGTSPAPYNMADPSNSGGGGSTGSGGVAGGVNAGYGGGSNDAVSPVIFDRPVPIDFESQYNDPSIDLEKYMKCFANIPDAGASGSIEIFTDIPVNGDPSKFFDWSNGSPGHTFIQLTKKNGSQSVVQNMGFYPKTGWKATLTPAPIPGKWVDNEGHEMNASYKLDITAAQVQTAVIKILNLSHYVQYDIDDYNCTDWALDVFNATVGVNQRLDIPRYNIPGGMAPNGTSTPNGIYIKLQEMKRAGGSSAAGITIPLIGWAGASKGPCN